MIEQDKLIEQTKEVLRSEGFKKKNKRWTKDIGEFTLVFYIQGSSYSKGDYYIRPGVFINAIEKTNSYYGHFRTQIEISDTESIFQEFFDFCETWTDKQRIKYLLNEFIKWDKRNPLEKRRLGQVDYEKDPVPSNVFFSVPHIAIDYILNNF
jgi:hypothetical protein